MAHKGTYSTPTRQQVEEAQELLAQHSAGKIKLSKAVLEELDRIETSFLWHLMDTPGDPEAAFAAMQQQRLEEQ
jgi:hypothetical protein